MPARLGGGRLPHPRDDLRTHQRHLRKAARSVVQPRDRARWYALFEARCRRWYGSPARTAGRFWAGSWSAPVAQTKPPFWVWNAGLRQLYLSVYHISPAFALRIPRRAPEYRGPVPGRLSSALDALAEARSRLRTRSRTPRRSSPTRSPLLRMQRERIEAAFECPVRETYGMSEIVAAANQCEPARCISGPRPEFWRRWRGRVSRAIGRNDQHRPDESGHAAHPLPHRRPLRARHRDPRLPLRPQSAAPRARSKGAATTSSTPATDAGWAAWIPCSRPACPSRKLRSCRKRSTASASSTCPIRVSTRASATELVRLVRDRLGDVEVMLEPVSACRAALTASSAPSSATAGGRAGARQIDGDPRACRTLIHHHRHPLP